MYRYPPASFSDKVALALTKILRFVADLFFRKRYCHRAVVLETVAAVPGMVAGMWLHLTSLRKMSGGYDDMIHVMLSEAQNERMHLMTFVALSKPSWFERMIILVAQAIFWNVYFIIYVFFPRTAHRITGYFEEEAVRSYTEFLEEIDCGNIQNVPAPQIAIDYWNMPQNSTLRDVVIRVKLDEACHRDVNHTFADEYDKGIWK